jgi:hypothetical protein
MPLPPSDAPRLDAMRALHALIDMLDDEQLLDRPSRDRIVTAFVGAFRREADAAHKRRFHLKLRGVRR